MGYTAHNGITATQDHTEGERILPTEGAIWTKIDGVEYLVVFTDGSAVCTASEWLHHGGWGVLTSEKAKTNVHGRLVGHPTTSYRAEVRAILEAISRIGTDACIVCDNQSAIQQLQKILECRGQRPTWSSEDECSDFWVQIAAVISQTRLRLCAKWMPSHLDDVKRKPVLDKYLAEGGDARWIEGNLAADLLAGKGAALAQPPEELMHKEKFRLLLTRAVQRMMVHIWSAHKGYLDLHKQDAQEVDLPESHFGLPGPWEEEWDPFDQILSEAEISQGLYLEEFDDFEGANYDLDDPDGGNDVRHHTAPPQQHYQHTHNTPATPTSPLAPTPTADDGVDQQLRPEGQVSNTPSGEMVSTGEQSTNLQRLKQAKERFAKASAHYPPAKHRCVHARLSLSEGYDNVEVHSGLSMKEIAIPSTTSKTEKVRLRRERLQPIAWFLDKWQ